MSAMSDDMDDLRAEQKRIASIPGRVAFVKLTRLSRTAKVFVGNAAVLLRHLRRMDDPAVLLPTVSNQGALEEFLDETERHLHNYVAAAQSRVEHFRKFIRAEWPEDSPFREEYQRRIDKEFAGAPLHNFIIKLRVLIQHVRLPVQTTEETWERGGAWTFRVLLETADLLRWDGWNAKAREYIEGSGKSVDLGRTVNTYSDQIMAFDRWVAEGFVRQHLEEIESYQRAVEEHQARLRRLGLLEDPDTP
jgi:hypothetical protein